MGEVAAFGQAHAHDGVAGLQKGQEHRFVGRCAAVRLHVGGFCTEQLFDAVNRQLLDDIDILAATVIAAAGVAFGVFVGELGACGLQYGGRGVVFAGDQFDVVFLALVLFLNGGPNVGIGVSDGVCGIGKHGSGFPSKLLTLAHNGKAAQANGSHTANRQCGAFPRGGGCLQRCESRPDPRQLPKQRAWATYRQ